MNDPFEINMTISWLRSMIEGDHVDKYQLEETICSLLGMKREIVELRAKLKIAREALERVVLYQAHNGDDWPARQAKEALATIKGDSNEQD